MQLKGGENKIKKSESDYAFRFQTVEKSPAKAGLFVVNVLK